MVIQYDTASIAEEFLMSDKQVKDMIDFSIKEVTAAFAREWQKTAMQKLGPSRAEYVNSIIVIDEGWGKGAVVLRGWTSNMVEEGVDSFDMKPGLLNGPNSKVGKDGKRYNTVPFSHGTPGALAENFNGGILPVEVYQVVKSKPQTISTKGGGVKSAPLSVDEIPKPFDEVKTVDIGEPESKNFRQYEHKSSIYEGIVKQKDKATGQNSYISFRRVSENSDPNSWIHPGIEPHHLAEETIQNFNIPTEVGKSIDNYLKSIGLV